MYDSNGYNVRSVKPIICTNTFKDQTTIPILVSDFTAWNNQTVSVATQQGAMITSMIQTVRDMVENYCWIDLTNAVYTAEFDIAPWGFSGMYANDIRLVLPRGPIWSMQSIQSIQYLDSTGIWNTFAPGANLGIDGIDANMTARLERSNWASIYFASAPNFDATRINAYKIQITFNAGYASSSAGPVVVSYNNSTGLVTVTMTTPGSLVSGQSVIMNGFSIYQPLFNGTYLINVLSPTQFTYQLAAGLGYPSPTPGFYSFTANPVQTIPQTLQTAIKMIVAYMYANRGDIIGNTEHIICASGAKPLLDQYSIAATKLGGLS